MSAFDGQPRLTVRGLVSSLVIATLALAVSIGCLFFALAGIAGMVDGLTEWRGLSSLFAGKRIVYPLALVIAGVAGRWAHRLFQRARALATRG